MSSNSNLPRRPEVKPEAPKATDAPVVTVRPTPVAASPNADIVVETPVIRGIPSEGREIGPHAMRPYKVQVGKPNGKLITYESK